MPIRIKNVKLAILALVGFCILLGLGNWQLNRAAYKREMQSAFDRRKEVPPLQVNDLNPSQDLRYYRVKLSGHFDHRHLLLDNKINHGKVGYEVFTPFQPNGSNLTILVDRGFIPVGKSRAELPQIKDIEKEVHLLGMLNEMPKYVSFGKMLESNTISWPLRIEYIEPNKIRHILNSATLLPYIVKLNPGQESAYDVNLEIMSMTPLRHIGYAVQWFALAITLLILFVALNLERT